MPHNRRNAATDRRAASGVDSGNFRRVRLSGCSPKRPSYEIWTPWVPEVQADHNCHSTGSCVSIIEPRRSRPTLDSPVAYVVGQHGVDYPQESKLRCKLPEGIMTSELASSWVFGRNFSVAVAPLNSVSSCDSTSDDSKSRAQAGEQCLD